MAPKVQSTKNVLEGDKHVANVQQMLMLAFYPLLKLWNKIISQEEDFESEAEELIQIFCKTYVLLDPLFKV